jgi:ABC-type multidrug transport system permease subunit
VVCTIHQPSIDIFEAFDDLLLMKVGGHIIYHGPLGKNSVKLVEYFEGLPGVPKLKEGLNPATWMLQISTPGMEKMIGCDFADAYKSSATFRNVQAEIDKLEVPPEGSRALHFDSQFAQSQWVQFNELIRRNLTSYARNPSYNGTRFIFGAVLGLLFGSILWQIGQKRGNIQDISNILGALYLSVLFLAFINSMSVQKVVEYERSVSYRETAAGMYSSLPFALSACAVEVPYILTQSILFCIISYWMIGFEATAAKYFWYQFFIFITLFLMTNYGIMTVYATPNIVAASISSSMFFGIWNLYAGFIIAPSQMPVYFRWYRYLNPIYWSLYGIIVSQLGDVQEVLSLGAGMGSAPVGEYLNASFGYKHSFIGWVALILVGYGLAFAVIAVIALQFLKFQKR